MEYNCNNKRTKATGTTLLYIYFKNGVKNRKKTQKINPETSSDDPIKTTVPV